MLRKFVEGLAFGAGFGIAFAVIWMGVSFGTFHVITSGGSPEKNPEFRTPKEAHILMPTGALPTEERKFSFFNHSSRMEIPVGGGILAMASLPAPEGSKRPNTYQ